MLKLYKSTGILSVQKQDKSPYPKLTCLVDTEIVRLTRALIPPIYRANLNRTKFAPHITTIRKEPISLSQILPFENQEVEFSYDPRVVSGGVYWWLNVWSEDLLQLRKSLGLQGSTFLNKPPSGFADFHITVGNTK